MSTQTQQRKVTADFITNIISLSTWKNHNERILVYANLVARLTPDETKGTILANATALAASALRVDKTDTSFREACYRCSKKIHRLVDDDGDYIWNDDGTLCDKWLRDQLTEAEALLKATPPALLPTVEKDLLQNFPYHRETHLINNRSYQTREGIPTVYAALDVLYEQGYRLNPDILTLKNLPMDLNINKNYAAKTLALHSIKQFQGEFFFKYTLDPRGRKYARSIVIQPQGASFDKAIINYSTAKPLGQYGLQALMIHYANCSNKDKLSFMDRIAWARTKGLEKALLMRTAANDWSLIECHIEDTKHAFEEYATAMDYLKALDYPNPEEYKSSLIVHQDATNSGFQFGAALTGDRQTAQDVNITANKTKYDKPADLYNKMAINLQRRLQNKPILELIPEVDRTFCKKPIMVTGYGAGIKAVMTDIQKWALTKKPMSDTTTTELKPDVSAALKQTASGMLKFTAIIRGQGAYLVETLRLETITWFTPDGFECIQEYRDNTDRRISLNDKLVTYTDLEGARRDPIDETKMATALPPNFIHSIDAQVVRTAALMAKEKDIAYCPIHDSFGTHAATFFSLNTILKEAFVETMNFPWYEHFCQTNGITAVNIKLGNYEAKECLKATYMFS